MKHYAACRADGVIQYVTNGFLPPESGEFIYVEVPPDFDAKMHHFADGEVHPGALDLRTLDDHKAQKWVEIKSRRAAMEFGGFVWDGSTFDSDEMSQSRIQGASQLATLAQIAGNSFSVVWTLADNEARTLSGTDMLAVGAAMGTHIMTVHSVGRALREQIEGATTIQEVEAISWPIT